MNAPLVGTESAKHAIARVRWNHDAIIDFMIANPEVSQGAIAKEFGLTESWLSRVINSDAFRARLAERKAEVIDPTLVQGFEDRLKGLAHTSLEIIQKKLDVSQNTDLAFKSLELTTKALGFGARERGGVSVQNTFVVALPEKAQDAQEWANSARKAPIDVAAKEVSNGG